MGARSGEAMSLGLLSKAMVSELFLVVALTMALTPLLAEIGQRLGKAFEKSDVKVPPPTTLACMQACTPASCCISHDLQTTGRATQPCGCRNRRCKRRRGRPRSCAGTSSSQASGASGRSSGSCWPSA